MAVDNNAELKKNTMTIAIATIGSKAITFILGPLYSFFLATSEYGEMDLVVTTASLLLPFICFDIYEATFRYSCDKEYDNKKVISTSMLFGIVGIFILIIGSFVFYQNANIDKNYIICVILAAAIDSFTTIFVQFARGLNKMKIYAFSGVINAIVLLVSNLIFIVIMKMGLKGWMISFIVSKVIVFIFLFLILKIYKYVSLKWIDLSYAKQFMKFCLPLLPTATMWWIMNVSDRYMIVAFVNTSATGIYSVSNKFPNVLSSFENVFYQAWQTTAINTSKNDNKDEYYSSVLNGYIQILAIVIAGSILVIKPVIEICFAKEYSSAWVCAPILFISVLLHAVNGNLGSLYSVFKKTNGAFFSTMLGALTNIILNIIFIPKWGLVGAAMTTMAGYLVTLVYRWFDTKKFVHLNIFTRNNFIAFVIILTQLLLAYINNWYSYLMRFVLLMILFWVNRNLIKEILVGRK